ncbi:DUF7344 domain-containing protein [Haloarcula brevis]|uniref:DUF7344 domain-containing protein n=1 Tax=Haloarcula brevis TaxID=3111453 RepID=UPI00300ED208
MSPTAGVDDAPAAEGTDGDGLDDATMFELLGNERRRACLQCLAAHETPQSVSALGREVARTVADAETDSDDLYDSVYVSLCQTHLPKLDAVGLVEYERERKQVRRGSRFDAIRRQFEAASTDEGVASDTFRVGLAASASTVVLGGAAVVSPPTVRTVLLLGLVAGHLLVLASTATGSN